MARQRSPGGQQQRQLLTEICARLIAEDGVTDYAQAKRKAARQLGCDETRNLPSHEEIDEAVRQYRSLYQSDSHPDILRAMRHKAVEVMQRLQRFDPWLTGPVLSGSAGPQSDIELLILTDDAKSVEFFLLNDGTDYRHAESSHPDVVRMIWLEDGMYVSLQVLPSRPGRLRPPQERMRLEGVRALAQEAPQPGLV